MSFLLGLDIQHILEMEHGVGREGVVPGLSPSLCVHLLADVGKLMEQVESCGLHAPSLAFSDGT